MKKTNVFLILFLLGISIYFISCKKDDFNFSKLTTSTEWNPSYAIPIAYGSMSMWDVIRDYDSLHLFQQDQSGFLFIMYNNKFGQVGAADKFKLPTQTFTESYTSAAFSFNGTGINATATKNDSKIYTIAMDPSDAKIDSVWIKTANLKLHLSSTVTHKIDLLVTFPTIKRSNGSVYSKTVQLNNPSTTSTVDSLFTDMAGCHMDLTNSVHASNTLPVNFTMSLTRTQVNSNAGSFDFSLSLDNLMYSTMFGYFGTKEIVFEKDSVDLKMFSDAFKGGYYFEDPRVIIKLKNSFGIPIDFHFTDLRANSTINNVMTDIKGTGVPRDNNIPGGSSSKTINHPSLAEFSSYYLTQPGYLLKSDSIKFDRTTSNINTAIGTSPHFISYGAKIVVNPVQTHTNFIRDIDSVKADVEVQLPLWGWANGLAIADTEKFQFSKYYHDWHGNVLQKALFRITSENGFPIEAGLQIYFMSYDSLRNPKYKNEDSLVSYYPPILLPAGATDADGKVISSNSLSRDILVDYNKLKRLYAMKISHIGIKAVFNSAESTSHKNVKFYSNYRLKIRAGMQCDFGTNTNSLRKYQ